MMSQPTALENLLVLDLTRILAGPYCTMLLGDFGARVIKIEEPSRGDETREYGPPFTARGASAYYLAVNRNKQSVTLNLKSTAGIEILRALARRADILVENFRVGTMDAWGIGYADLRALNPRLIYCAITGYGQTGPDKDRPGVDTIIQAQGGIMSITGPANGEPYKVGVAIADITAGMNAAIAILAALYHRDQTGAGQFIDLSLFDSQLGWLANVASAYLVSGAEPKRYGNAHATVVPYQLMSTRDGAVMLGVATDRQFQALCKIINRDAWATDARFATNAARVVQRAELISELEKIFRARSTAEWMADLVRAKIPCGPVNDIPTALAEPQTIARAMVQTIELDGEKIKMIGPVPKFSRTPARIALAPPRLGEQTDLVLRELLQYDAAQIAQLRAAGTI